MGAGRRSGGNECQSAELQLLFEVEDFFSSARWTEVKSKASILFKQKTVSHLDSNAPWSQLLFFPWLMWAISVPFVTKLDLLLLSLLILWWSYYCNHNGWCVGKNVEKGKYRSLFDLFIYGRDTFIMKCKTVFRNKEAPL